MALNRFDRRQNLRSTFVPQEYTPNFQLLAQALGQQQQSYDQAIEVSNKLPQHLQADRADVLAYKQEQQDRMSKVVEAYKKDGIQGGNAARKSFLDQTKQDFSPLGRAHGIEQNFNTYNEYKKDLDKQLSDGRITNETYNAALRKSMTDFGKSYGDDGVFKEFGGYKTAEDIDLIAMTDKYLTGWKPDTIQGKKVDQLAGGQYYYLESNEMVNPDDIHLAANQYINSNPQIQAYLNQLDVLDPREYTATGLDGKEMSLSHSEYVMGDALSSLSSKHGYMKQDIKTMANWRLKQRLSHAHDKRNDGLLYGEKYNSQVANAPIGKIDLSGGVFGGANQRLTDASQYHRAERAKADKQYEENIASGMTEKDAQAIFGQAMAGPLENLANAKANRDNPTQVTNTLNYLTSPEAQLRYPGIKNAITSLQRNNNESSEEFAKRAVEVYNKAADASSQYIIRNRSYGSGDVGRKARANDHDRFLGSEGPGELVGMNYQVMDPSGKMVQGKPIGALIEELGYKDTKTKTAYQQFRENATFLGTVEDGAGQVIEGAGHIVVADAKGRPYEIYANTENTMSHTLRRQVQTLREGYRNFDKNLSDTAYLQTPNGPVAVQSKYVFDEERGRYRIGIDPNTGEEISETELLNLERMHMQMVPQR